MQPYLFPYIGYWQLINNVDMFVIFDDVNFIKRGYINRNYILIQGKSKLITLELIKASQNKLIKEIEVGYNSDKLIKTIEMAYKRAPYFKKVFPLIVEILSNKEKNLVKFLSFSLEKISDYLKLNTMFIYSSDIKKDNRLKGQNKIIDICKKIGAKEYVNPIGGITLYKKEVFEKEEIKLKFLKSKKIEYKQFKNEFVPNLSIVDVMMFNDKEKIGSFLKEYDLI